MGVSNWKQRLLNQVLARIGGNYFASKDATRLWDDCFGSAKPRNEQLDPKGDEFHGSLFANSFGGLN